jgi:hypothetical protein
MYKIQFVIEHIQKVYGFELVPCSIPRSRFQYFKRNFYLFIHNKISKRLFFFLRDKVSPIRYLDERPNGEIWFRNSEGRISIEFEITPIPPEACFYIGNRNISFSLNHINGIEQVDKHFSEVDELKQILRDYKLKNILN